MLWSILPLAFDHVFVIEDRYSQGGDTALLIASRCGHTVGVELLLGAGAELEATGKVSWGGLNGLSCEGWGVRAGDNPYLHQDGYTALIVAAQKGHTAVVRVLQRAGARLEASDDLVRWGSGCSVGCSVVQRVSLNPSEW